MKYDVFISYSRRDYIDDNKQVIPGNIISQIKDLFDKNNISYWFDEEGVYSGDAFAPVIARNIKAAKIFLFISSEHANASEWTSNEIATAHAYNKKIIPFRYDDSVYNDSVIIYIARLDYIDHKNNPSKSLARLLKSVQNYLKEERDKMERERQEEERRRHAEISRRERAAKLRSLRERIEKLENKKFDIEKEILTQESSLSDLRNEKRILKANILNLQSEEAALLGHNGAKREPKVTSKKPEEKPKMEKPAQPGFFAREWTEFKSAMALKHWTVNSIYISACIVTVFWTCFVTSVVSSACLALFFAGVASLLGLYRVMKNQKSGILWLVISFVCANLIPVMTECRYNDGSNWVWRDTYRFIYDDWDVYIGILCFSICLFLLLCTSLFIRKNGKSAWSLLQTQTKGGKKDKLYFAFLLCMTMMAYFTVSSWTHW